MFACIYRQSVSENDRGENAPSESLVDLAFTFSPLVEQTSVDTVVLDIEGCDLMFAARPGFSEALGSESRHAGCDEARQRRARQPPRKAATRAARSGL